MYRGTESGGEYPRVKVGDKIELPSLKKPNVFLYFCSTFLVAHEAVFPIP